MQRQIGVYVQEQAKLFEKLVVVLGGRYDFAKSESTEHVFNTESGPRTAPSPGVPAWSICSTTASRPMPATRNPSCRSSAPMPTVMPFEPEEGEQYEVGLKYQPPGWNSFVTLSLFDLVKQTC